MKRQKCKSICAMNQVSLNKKHQFRQGNLSLLLNEQQKKIEQLVNVIRTIEELQRSQTEKSSSQKQKLHNEITRLKTIISEQERAIEEKVQTDIRCKKLVQLVQKIVKEQSEQRSNYLQEVNVYFQKLQNTMKLANKQCEKGYEQVEKVFGCVEELSKVCGHKQEAYKVMMQQFGGIVNAALIKIDEHNCKDEMGKIIEIVKQIEENSVNKSKVDKLDNHSERSGKYNTIDRIAKTVKQRYRYEQLFDELSKMKEIFVRKQIQLTKQCQLLKNQLKYFVQQGKVREGQYHNQLTILKTQLQHMSVRYNQQIQLPIFSMQTRICGQIEKVCKEFNKIRNHSELTEICGKICQAINKSNDRANQEKQQMLDKISRTHQRVLKRVEVLEQQIVRRDKIVENQELGQKQKLVQQLRMMKVKCQENKLSRTMEILQTQNRTKTQLIKASEIYIGKLDSSMKRMKLKTGLNTSEYLQLLININRQIEEQLRGLRYAYTCEDSALLTAINKVQLRLVQIDGNWVKLQGIDHQLLQQIKQLLNEQNELTSWLRQDQIMSKEIRQCMNLFYTNFVEPIGAFSKLDQQVKYLKEVHQFHEHQLAQERQLKMLQGSLYREGNEFVGQYKQLLKEKNEIDKGMVDMINSLIKEIERRNEKEFKLAKQRQQQAIAAHEQQYRELRGILQSLQKRQTQKNKIMTKVIGKIKQLQCESTKLMKGVEWSMKQKIDKIIVVLSNMQKKQERLKKEQGMVRESLVAEKGEKGMEKWDMLKINVEIINDLKQKYEKCLSENGMMRLQLTELTLKGEK